MKASSLAALTIVLAGFVTCNIPSAQAKGTVRVQQSNGSVQTYPGATFKVVNKTLRITTADKAGTLIITDAACSLADKILMCLPYAMELQQGGATRPLDFDRGTVYYNKAADKQQLRFSSTQLPPNGIIGALKSKRGTYVTFTGTLDGRGK